MCVATTGVATCDFVCSVKRIAAGGTQTLSSEMDERDDMDDVRDDARKWRESGRVLGGGAETHRETDGEVE